MDSDQHQPRTTETAHGPASAATGGVAAAPRLGWDRLLTRGESTIASVGIAVAAILLAVMASSAWWTVRTQRAALEADRAEQVGAVGDLLAQSAESLLSA